MALEPCRRDLSDLGNEGVGGSGLVVLSVDPHTGSGVDRGAIANLSAISENFKEFMKSGTESCTPVQWPTTRRLRPHRQSHRILECSIATRCG